MKSSIKQSYLIKILVVLFFAFTLTNTYATNTQKSPNTEKDATAKKSDSIEKIKAAIAKMTESEKAKEASKYKRPMPVITEPTIKTISILFFVVMLVLIVLFFIQAYLKNMYLGFQSIKFIGLVIMFPGICIIALVGGDLISGSTLAALLGTIAGYVLSREDDSTKDALKKEKDELTKANTTLKTEVERLKALVNK